MHCEDGTLEVARQDGARPVSGAEREKDGRRRWGQVSLLLAFTYSGLSERQYCEYHGVNRSTFRYWRRRQTAVDDEPDRVAFFEHPAGVRFLHQMQTAAHFVFGQQAGVGIDSIVQFLDLCGLAPYLALSEGHQHGVQTRLQQAILDFGRQQTAPTAAVPDPVHPVEVAMVEAYVEREPVTVALDETYHPRPCLVAMDPASGFIFLERYVDAVNTDTWLNELNAALAGIHREVVQTVSDQGKAVMGVAHRLGAHFSPDLFHILQPLVRTLLRPLHKALADADKALSRASTRLEATALTAPIAQRLKARQALDRARIRQTALVDLPAQAKALLLSLSDAYHPVCLITGQLRSAELVHQEMESHVAALEQVVKAASLPPAAAHACRRVRSNLDAMKATIAFWHKQVDESRESNEITGWIGGSALENLVASSYLDLAATRGRDGAQRQALKDLAARRLQETEALMQGVDCVTVESLKVCARRCAALFARSSSCVEGRNGRLALLHHGRHRLDGDKLAASTVIHNYWIRRPDRTTAAMRFFQRDHGDLFDSLLEQLPLPARPAKRRSQTFRYCDR